MYLVKGYIVEELAGFETKRYFDGFIREVLMIENDLILDGFRLPAKQVSLFTKVTDRGYQTLTFKREQIVAKHSKPTVVHPEVLRLTDLANELMLLVGMEYRVMQKLRFPDETLVTKFNELCEFQLTLLHGKEPNYESIESILEWHYTDTIKHLQASMTMKEFLNAYSRR